MLSVCYLPALFLPACSEVEDAVTNAICGEQDTASSSGSSTCVPYANGTSSSRGSSGGSGNFTDSGGGGVLGSSCVSSLSWAIDVAPDVHLPTAQDQELRLTPRCISPTDPACEARSIAEFLQFGYTDHVFYRINELNITLPSASSAFMMGLGGQVPSLLTAVQSLTVTCTQPAPVFARHVVGPLVQALTLAPIGGFYNSLSSQPSLFYSPPLTRLSFSGCALTGGLPEQLNYLLQLRVSGDGSAGLPEWGWISLAACLPDLVPR